MAQKQFLFGQKRNSGEEKKKKASLFASFPNGAGLGTADADSVLESTTCRSSLTRQLDTTSPNVVAEPTRGNMLAAYPKQTPTKANFYCGKFSHGKVFPTYNFELFFSFVKGRCIIWEPIWRGGVLTLWNVDPEQKRCCPRSFRDS